MPPESADPEAPAAGKLATVRRRLAQPHTGDHPAPPSAHEAPSLEHDSDIINNMVVT